ncbi:MAG: sulfite exporter TauE/SafE family protein [Solidesulfovibrio sp.]
MQEIMLPLLQSALGLFTLAFAFVFGKDIVANKRKITNTPSWNAFGFVGMLTNFFDALGIGSYAPTTAIFKFFKMVPDRIIPGTLTVSMTVPVIAEAFIFTTIIKVEPTTLFTMIAASIVGAVFGASIVARMPEKKIQLGMGAALFIVAVIFIAGLLGIMPVGGEAIGLTGMALIIGIVGNLILGALMTIGIGLYAPCMALVYALGMSPRVAFPIMMASCAFLMPAAGIKFIKEQAYDMKSSIIISITGVLGVLIAAYVVKELPLTILKWLVVVVILYTSAIMIRSAIKKPSAAADQAENVLVGL